MLEMMKLSEAFKHRIVIHDPCNIFDSIEACTTFIESLSLDPVAGQRYSKIQNILQRIDNIETLPKEYREKKNVLFDEIIPFLQKIAPEDCYFGSHPYDAKIIGFWEKSLLIGKNSQEG
jgi:hypothetical protein